MKAIRNGRWKLVFPGKSRSYAPPATLGHDRYPGESITVEVPMGLYDLTIDPGEARNVIAQYPEIVKQLNEIADRYRHELGDGLTHIVGTEVRPAAVVTQ